MPAAMVNYLLRILMSSDCSTMLDMIILNISKDVSRKSNSVGTMGVRTYESTYFVFACKRFSCLQDAEFCTGP